LISLVTVLEKPGSKIGFLIGMVVLAVAVTAVSGMVLVGPDMDKLLARTKAGDIHQRIAAVHQLGSIDNVRATDALVDLIHDKDPRIQAEAAFALGNAPVHIMAIVPLTKALRHENSDVRKNAARALGVQIGHQKHKMYSATVDELIARLQDENTDVRSAAADALGWIGSKKAIEPLIAILGDEKTRFSAHNALITITNQRLGDDPAEWRAWMEKQ
jgi:HEAT repeat protein